jgi:cytochrome c oxidase subunit IV
MERDDLIVNDSYSVEANHDEAHGKEIRKKIYFVTILLSVITTVEVALGVFIKQGTDFWPVVKWSFIVMTLVKAFYIVAVFMHLGDERKSLQYVIIVPYAIFILYLLYIGLTESSYLNELWREFQP